MVRPQSNRTDASAATNGNGSARSNNSSSPDGKVAGDGAANEHGTVLDGRTRRARQPRYIRGQRIRPAPSGRPVGQPPRHTTGNGTEARKKNPASR